MNKLLNRQIKRIFGKDFVPDKQLQAFFEVVKKTYTFYDSDRTLLDRAMDLSSWELTEANIQLKKESKRIQKLLKQLQSIINDLRGIDSEKDITQFDTTEIEEMAEFLHDLVTQLQQNEALLREKEHQIIDAQRMAKFGNWSLDLISQKIDWSPQLYEITGIDPSIEHLDLQSIGHLLRKEGNSEFVLQLKLCIREGENSFVHRFEKDNGELIWIESHISVEYDSDEKPQKVYGTAIDVTERVDAEQKFSENLKELSEANKHLDTIIDSLPVLLFIKDANTRKYIRVNDIASKFYNIPKEDFLNKTPEELFDGEMLEMIKKQDEALMNKGSMLIDHEHYSNLKGKGAAHLITKKVPLKDIEGNIKYIISVSEDITSRYEFENALRLAKDKAEQANRAKSAFLSSMSHELRTPLNAIIGYAQILKNDSKIPQNKRSYIDTMYRSGHHLLSMINDVLDLSKSESGNLDFLNEPFHLNDLLTDIEDIFKLKCQNKNIELRLEIDPNLPKGYISDSRRIQQILINLMSNAVKFTQTGYVKLSVTEGSRNESSESYKILRFTVEDTGRGIPENQLESIFEPFSQVKGVFNEGTGLGLTISNKLANIMGGKISVESKPGQGSTFWFEIPAEIIDTSKVERDKPNLTYTLPDNLKLHALIVDDIPSNRSVVKILLETAGIHCEECTNGREALDMVKTHKPDFILMDLMMPVMDGITATEVIKNDYQNISLPIIALTAKGSGFDSVEVDRSLFNGFIQKPFKAGDLFQTIEECLNITFNRSQECHNETIDSTEEPSIHTIADNINKLDSHIRNKIIHAIDIQSYDDLISITDTAIANLNRGDSSTKQWLDTLTTLKNQANSNNFSFFLDLEEILNL